MRDLWKTHGRKIGVVLRRSISLLTLIVGDVGRALVGLL